MTAMAPARASNGSVVAGYYAHPAVRARIREYCSAHTGAAPSCVFLSADLPGEPPPTGWSLHPKLPPDALDDLLDRGADVFRSVLDVASLPFYVDVDYLNARLPGHAYARPEEVFAKLEPTYQAIVELLGEYGIETLRLMTGRGYQFTGRVPFNSPVFGRIAALAPETPDWHDACGTRVPPWLRLRITTRYARAYVAMGLLLEYFAHRVIRRAASRSSVPLVLNGTNVGEGEEGREAVSLDLSFAGDPADVRHMRVAFGAYQSHRFRPDIYGPEVAALDPIAAVPRGERTLVEMLEIGRHPIGAAAVAESCKAQIPVAAAGLELLASDYTRSSLAAFHRQFFATPPHPPSSWPETYDRFDLAQVPPCVAVPLATPNDWLLKPEYLQHVTRFLISQGWAPRHVAGLVWSKYAQDCNWGERWRYLSPRSRAEFDVRVFAGMLITGLDRCVDFNCRSTQEKIICPGTGCPHDLRVARERLLQQVDRR